MCTTIANHGLAAVASVFRRYADGKNGAYSSCVHHADGDAIDLPKIDGVPVVTFIAVSVLLISMTRVRIGILRK